MTKLKWELKFFIVQLTFIQTFGCTVSLDHIAVYVYGLNTAGLDNIRRVDRSYFSIRDSSRIL